MNRASCGPDSQSLDRQVCWLGVGGWTNVDSRSSRHLRHAGSVDSSIRASWRWSNSTQALGRGALLLQDNHSPRRFPARLIAFPPEHLRFHTTPIRTSGLSSPRKRFIRRRWRRRLSHLHPVWPSLGLPQASSRDPSNFGSRTQTNERQTGSTLSRALGDFPRISPQIGSCGSSWRLLPMLGLDP
ncbi:hypothetical protein VTG60DRAFT_6448 [Thermothelomyces hinnuleus]